MRLSVGVIASLASIAALCACDWATKNQAPEAKSETQLAAERNERIRKACASDATYDRLKELVFDEAARIRNADPRNLDPLAAGSVVRMEEPVVKSRDEDLNVTVCKGRFIMELPPGAENAFDGLRRVSADVEYSAQAAADGSGLVYQIDGAEPIIYRLATFGMTGKPLPRIAMAERPSQPDFQPGPLMDPVAPAPRSPPATVSPAPAPAPAPANPESRTVMRTSEAAPARAASRPSFNCRYARTRSERLVCASPSLAARDRAMSSLYYSAIAGADAATKSRIRASRDAFLARRERCASEACVAEAYAERVAEIGRLAGE